MERQDLTGMYAAINVRKSGAPHPAFGGAGGHAAAGAGLELTAPGRGCIGRKAHPSKEGGGRRCICRGRGRGRMSL